jgi:hypothetical protein
LALAGPTGNFASWTGERATWAERCSTAARIASAVVGMAFSNLLAFAIEAILGEPPTKA